MSEITWPVNSVVFCKTKEQWGGLSNMSCEYKVRINGVLIHHLEGLYQSLRYPNRADIQREIVNQRSSMGSKMKSKKYYSESREDWEEVREDLMYWCLKVKLFFNWNKFSKLLLDTGEKDIVELSRRDKFWGAVKGSDGVLRGNNTLGIMLTILRDEIKEGTVEKGVFPELTVSGVRFLGEKIKNG